MTEGYNILPNFFISAKLNEMFSYDDDNIEKTDRKRNRHKRVQFDNRLFDRDTLLLSHYDVNFLYVLSLYARDNQSQKTAWKMKVRQCFCKEIQKWLDEDYDFYFIKAKTGVDDKEYLRHISSNYWESFTHLLSNIRISTPWHLRRERSVSRRISCYLINSKITSLLRSSN